MEDYGIVNMFGHKWQLASLAEIWEDCFEKKNPVFSALASKLNTGFTNKVWYGMFFACRVWCAADVSRIRRSRLKYKLLLGLQFKPPACWSLVLRIFVPNETDCCLFAYCQRHRNWCTLNYACFFRAPSWWPRWSMWFRNLWPISFKSSKTFLLTILLSLKSVHWHAQLLFNGCYVN